MITATAERRRSDRLLMTIPLRVEGTDRNGQPVEYDGRAISLNRHGARIQSSRPLDKGQAIRVKSMDGDYDAEFRVVELLPARGGQESEYGVECVNEKENFWGIEFPASDHGDAAAAKVLLECEMCRTIALQPLTLLEVEALRTDGRVGKLCQNCDAVSPWRYAEIRVPPLDPAEMTECSMEGRPSWVTPLIEPIDSGHRRVYMQIPLGVRDCRGNAEVTRTENISKCGFCFASEKKYLLGEIINAVFPLDSITQKTELPARIVREQAIAGSDRKIYGATFDAQSSSRLMTA